MDQRVDQRRGERGSRRVPRRRRHRRGCRGPAQRGDGRPLPVRRPRRAARARPPRHQRPDAVRRVRHVPRVAGDVADDQSERVALAASSAPGGVIGAPVRRGERGRAVPLLAAVPAVLWMVAFFVLPLVVFAFYSFLTNAFYDVAFPLTTDAYEAAITSPLNRTLAWNSVSVGVTTAVVTVAIGLPVAYWLRFVAGRSRVAVLFLITSSMFASYLVRIYAWRTILGSRGLVNSTLDRVGLIDEPLSFLLY